MVRKIKWLGTADSNYDSINGEITEFWKPIERFWEKEYKSELWYKQNNREINGKYVVEVEWKVKND